MPVLSLPRARASCLGEKGEVSSASASSSASAPAWGSRCFPLHTAMAAVVSSAGGLLAMLNEAHTVLKLHSLTKLNALVDNFWPEISTSVSTINYCRTSTLDPKKVKGKIIACLSDSIDMNILKDVEVKEAGGVRMIVCNDEDAGNVLNPEAYFLPATQLSLNDSKEVFAYINSTRFPAAYVGPPFTKLWTTQ